MANSDAKTTLFTRRIFGLANFDMWMPFRSGPAKVQGSLHEQYVVVVTDNMGKTP